MGPIAQYCPVEGSGSAPGPHEHQLLCHLGLAITVFCSLSAVPTMPFCHHQKETKGSKSGGGGRFGPCPTLLSPCPLFPSPERRCSYQKRLLKDDLFYFSLTFSSLEKEKKNTKSTIKDKKKKKNPKPPPNPQKVMSFPYPWNSFCFVLFLEIIFF